MTRKTLVVVAAAAVAVIVGYRACLDRPEIVNSTPRGTTIVCFGDSLTAGTGAPPGRSYPDRLAELLGEPVVNAGVPGDTTASALERRERDVLARDPRIVCITLGGNDLMRDVRVEEAFANLRSIVRRMQESGALVVVGGLELPMLDRGYRAAYGDLCRELGCVLVEDVYDGIMGRGELMSDRIHPNAAGYERMARHFERALRPYL